MALVQALPFRGVLSELANVLAHMRYFEFPLPDLPSAGFPAPRVTGCIFCPVTPPWMVLVGA
ncbi:hypothetical protein BJL96_38675 [Burkholderia cenocepacia]|nr:hypothetical protein A3203_14665 [Burkholderia cenocepacia]AOK64589.1 hypothetical protein WM33_02940 [Burkholderia multivorans]KVR77558.1 hypothetical protein WK26_22120 [Burkholderia vietnamiensis]KVS06745.1 hypothetical protein WK29_23555 [Burkholderia vietnamiensis]KVZ77687.1 hypothetical protein WL23_19720 [Burkholderia multivorans]